MARCLLVAFIVCAIVSLAQSVPVKRSCNTHNPISTLKTALLFTTEASNPTYTGSNPMEGVKQRMIARMAELMELRNTVNDLLQAEGESATVKTKALSVIINKTSEQACEWVKNNLLSDPGMDCSSPSLEIKQLMVRIQVYEAAKDLRNTLQSYSSVPGLSNPCTWVSCHNEGSENRQLVGVVVPSCSHIN